MPRYRPIHRWEDLPPPSGDWQTRESYVLDFKSNVDPEEWWELGKDMAAFANSLGGVILIGAKELPQGANYHGLPQEKATAIKVAYENVHLERLRPRPVVDVAPIPVPQTNRLMVAVNVEPFPDQPVGAMAYKLTQKGERWALSAPGAQSSANQPDDVRDRLAKSSDAWRFPYRVGRDTRYFSPEQLPMMINGAIRRTVLLLEGIPEAARRSIELQCWFSPGVGTAPTVQPARLDDVEAIRNVVRFTHVDPHQRSVELRIPLEDIEAVWEAEPGKWRVRVHGQLIHTTGPRVVGYMSLPR